MATTTTTSLIGRTRPLLVDGDEARWTGDELLDYLNEGRAFLAAVQRTPFMTTSKHDWDTGTPRQQVPDELLSLTAIRRADGQFLRPVSLDTAMQVNPEWAGRTGTPKEFWFDPKDPRAFWVTPAPSQSGQVEVTGTREPTPLKAGDDLDVSVSYEPFLTNYIMYRALSKEQETQDFNRAQAYYNQALSYLTPSARARISYSPASGGPIPDSGASHTE